MKCSGCNADGQKNGRSKKGVQRYRCKRCDRFWQSSYQYKACEQGISQKIVVLKRESCGIRSIARILNISVTTVIERIKRIGRSIQRPFCIVKGKAYEVDEMRTFIGNK